MTTEPASTTPAQRQRRAVITGTSTPLALARAINILRAEHGGPDWDDDTPTPDDGTSDPASGDEKERTT